LRVVRSVVRAPVFAPALVAAVTRISVFLVADRHPSRFLSPDALEYDRLARHFLDAYAHARSGSLFDLSLLRTPGYPAFVAAVYAVSGRVVAHVIVVEVVLGVATVVMTYFLAERLVGRPAATLAAFVLAVDPVSIAMGSNLTTEVLFAFLWVVAALLWARGLQGGSPWWAGSAGLVLGLSALVRPIAAYLPALLVPLTLVTARASAGRRALASCALLVAFAVPVGLWIARNATETGVATISTIESVNLLTYRAADALAIDTGVSRDEASLELSREVAARAKPGANAAEISRVQDSVAFHTLVHHPGGAAISTVEGFGRVLFGPGRAELLRLVRGYDSPRDAGDDVLLLVSAGLLFATLALALVGVVVLVRERSWLVLVCTLTFVAYDILLASGAEGNGRLRMPAMPFLAVLAGAGGARLLRRRGARAGSLAGSIEADLRERPETA
jgi:4-amino-4-deoxy-L-arabinose transferase-like glycosyltransferase